MNKPHGSSKKTPNPAGHSLLEVAIIRMKEGFKGNSAIAELKVRESEPLPGNESPSRVGETVDSMENLSDQKKGSVFMRHTCNMRPAPEHAVRHRRAPD